MASVRPLTIVTGPAGVGKTIAVADWVTNGRPPGTVVWVALDASDRDVERLWPRVVDAIATTVGPAVLDGLTAPLTPDAPFLAAVAARSGGLVVILDDAEKLGGGTALSAIDSVLATPPEGFHLVLVSRHDPAMSLHRLRLADRLAEVRFSDLAFTTPEARALLVRAGVTLDDDVIDKLVDATGGWAAALRLVAHSLRGVDDPLPVLARLDGGHPLVSEYLWDEVVAGLPDDAYQVLLRTSVTSRVCGSLARALTDNPDADAVLRSLARDELLVQEVGHAGWFRSYSLLRRVLHARLVAERPELERELRHVAVEWFEENGDGFEALAQAIETRDWEFAGQVAVRSTAPAVFSSRQPELTALLGELPAVFASVHPEVAAVLALRAHFVGDVSGVASMVAFAEAGIEALPEPRRSLATLTVRVAQALHANRSGANPVACAAAGEAEALLLRLGLSDAYAWGPARPNVTGLHANVRLWCGDPAGASDLLASLDAHVSDRALQGFGGVYFLGLRALIETLRGVRLPYARSLAQSAVALSASMGRTHGHESQFAWLALALTELGRGEIEASSDALRACAEAGIRGLNANATAAMLVVAVQVDIARGDLASARRTLSEVDSRVARQPGLILVAMMAAALRAQLELAAGAPDRARSVLAAYDALNRPTPSPDPLALTRARVLLATGSPGEVRSTLVHHLSGGGVWTCEAWLLVSHAESKLRHDASSIEAFSRALDEAVEQDFSYLFLQPSRWLTAALGRHLLTVGTHREFVQRVQHLGTEVVPTPEVEEPTHIPAALTQRELAVLAYLPTMSSNAEIADALSISVNTVKQHLKSAYRKLGVATRRDAVRTARVKGMLPT